MTHQDLSDVEFRVYGLTISWTKDWEFEFRNSGRVQPRRGIWKPNKMRFLKATEFRRYILNPPSPPWLSDPYCNPGILNPEPMKRMPFTTRTWGPVNKKDNGSGGLSIERHAWIGCGGTAPLCSLKACSQQIFHMRQLLPLGSGTP